MAYELRQQSPEWATGVASILNPLAQAGTQVYAAKTQAALNVQRAKMGLPPIDFSARPATSEAEGSRGPSDSDEGSALTPILVIGGIAVVGFIIFKMTRK